MLSSFTFNTSDDSPPANSAGFVSAVTCGSGWQCQHRTRAVKNMVGFHNATHADPSITNWWSDGSDAIAFGRGTNGWIAVNNESGAQASRTYSTGLPAGTYCDIIHGDWSAGACSGPTVTVNGSGQATVTVAAKDAVAIDVNARVSGTATTTPTAAPPTNPAGTYTINFRENATTWYGQNVFVVGSIPVLGSWNTANAVALSSAGYPVWTAAVTMPASTYFEYKYIKKDPDGTIEWESGANRYGTTLSSGSTTFNDSWKSSAAS